MQRKEKRRTEVENASKKKSRIQIFEDDEEQQQQQAPPPLEEEQQQQQQAPVNVDQPTDVMVAVVEEQTAAIVQEEDETLADEDALIIQNRDLARMVQKCNLMNINLFHPDGTINVNVTSNNGFVSFRGPYLQKFPGVDRRRMAGQCLMTPFARLGTNEYTFKSYPFGNMFAAKYASDKLVFGLQDEPLVPSQQDNAPFVEHQEMVMNRLIPQFRAEIVRNACSWFSDSLNTDITAAKSVRDKAIKDKKSREFIDALPTEESIKAGWPELIDSKFVMREAIDMFNTRGLTMKWNMFRNGSQSEIAYVMAPGWKSMTGRDEVTRRLLAVNQKIIDDNGINHTNKTLQVENLLNVFRYRTAAEVHAGGYFPQTKKEIEDKVKPIARLSPLKVMNFEEIALNFQPGDWVSAIYTPKYATANGQYYIVFDLLAFIWLDHHDVFSQAAIRDGYMGKPECLLEHIPEMRYTGQLTLMSHIPDEQLLTLPASTNVEHVD